MSAMKGRREFLGEPHQAQRLAVALGIGAAEVALDVLLQLAAFLMADDGALATGDRGEAAGHRLVIGKKPVAAEFDEVRERKLEVIERIGARGMAGDLHALPGGEVQVNLAFGFLDLRLHVVDFVVEVDVVGAGVAFEIGELFLELDDRFFKFKRLQFHSRVTGSPRRSMAASSEAASGLMAMPVGGFETVLGSAPSGASP